MSTLGRHEDPRARVWVPLSVGYLDDPVMSACSTEAQLVYLRGLLHAKRAASDGVVSLRIITGALWEVMEPADVRAAVDELTAADKWLRIDVDTYEIARWAKYNDRPDSGANRSRSGAMKGNHQRWHIARNVVDPDCPICNGDINPEEEEPQVNRTDIAPESPPTRGTDRPRVAPESLEGEGEGELDNPHLQLLKDSTANGDDDGSRRMATGPAVVAHSALSALGLPDPKPSVGEQRTVERALDAGATVSQVVDLAHKAVDANPGNVRAYWAKSVANLAQDVTERRKSEPNPMANIAGDEAFAYLNDTQVKPEIAKANLAAARAALHTRKTT